MNWSNHYWNSNYRFEFDLRRWIRSRTASLLINLFFCSCCSTSLCILSFASLSVARFSPFSLFCFLLVYFSTYFWSRKNSKFWGPWFHLASNLVLTKNKLWIQMARIENLLFGWPLRCRARWKGCSARCKIPGAFIFFESPPKFFCFVKFL